GDLPKTVRMLTLQGGAQNAAQSFQAPAACRPRPRATGLAPRLRRFWNWLQSQDPTPALPTAPPFQPLPENATLTCTSGPAHPGCAHASAPINCGTSVPSP
ncbi:hypothetical protein P7K49_001840, partial [Saguinus oedipus]